jgi:PKD repeat protein
MSSRSCLLFLLVVVVFGCARDRSSPVGPEAQPPALTLSAGEDYVPGHVLVRFRAGAPSQQLLAGHGASVRRDLLRGIKLVRVPEGRELQVAAALARNPWVEFAELDYLRTFGVPCESGECEPPTDVYFGYKWDLHNDGTITNGSGNDLAITGQVDADIDWLEAHEHLGAFGGAALVGIIDTGVQATHEDLAGRVAAQWDFQAGDPDASDDRGHGTHVAGIIAAHGDNGRGVTGVAYGANIGLVVAKVCGPIYKDGVQVGYGCPVSALVEGIRWAADQGAHVLNISLGGSKGSVTEQEALQYARSRDVLPFCAAGNNSGPVAYPAAYAECVAVSATDWSDGLASYSSFGPQIDLAAPGGDSENRGYSYILSTYWNKNKPGSTTSYAFMSGTSMAAPQAAGLAALLHAVGWTDDDAKLQRMKETVDDLGTPGADDQFGAGRINAYAAVTGSAPTNAAPAASFTHGCDYLECSFTDASTDSDGSIVAWDWAFGDGASSPLQDPTHAYATAGSYTVSLTVTDDQGATDTSWATITVEEAPGTITLAVTKRLKSSGARFNDLAWSGAAGTYVLIFLNGSKLKKTPNDGVQPHRIYDDGTYAYKICELPPSTTCSNEAAVTWP